MYDIKNLKIWKETERDNPFLSKVTFISMDACIWEKIIMKSGNYDRIKDIFDQCGITVTDAKKGHSFQFKIYLSEKMAATDIEALELNVRSFNCLKRAGINTIGALCERIHSSNDLKMIRNCGDTSVAEIMDKLFYYHLCNLPEKRQKEYLAEIIGENNIVC